MMNFLIQYWIECANLIRIFAFMFLRLDFNFLFLSFLYPVLVLRLYTIFTK